MIVKVFWINDFSRLNSNTAMDNIEQCEKVFS